MGFRLLVAFRVCRRRRCHRVCLLGTGRVREGRRHRHRGVYMGATAMVEDIMEDVAEVEDMVAEGEDIRVVDVVVVVVVEGGSTRLVSSTSCVRRVCALYYRRRNRCGGQWSPAGGHR